MHMTALLIAIKMIFLRKYLISIFMIRREVIESYGYLRNLAYLYFEG